jgi:hypothetical protein
MMSMKLRKTAAAVLVLTAAGAACLASAGAAPAPLLQDKDKDKKAREQSIDNLKQIGLAMHNFHDSYKRMPPHALYKDKTPLLSWRVAILPYIEQGDSNILYQQFKLDEPWDSENNKKLIAKMPKIYEPVGMGQKHEGHTYYQVFTGEGSVFDGTRKVTLATITNQNGTVNTVMVVEGKRSVVWSKPEDIALPSADEKTLPLGGLFNDRWHAVFCDGAVHTFGNDMPISVLRMIARYTNATPIDLEKYEKK